MQVEIDPDAEEEISEAFDWYLERSERAAIRFVSEVNRAIEKITKDPARFLFTYAGCQQCALRRFPYCVVFHADAQKIYIVAIAHAKRRPGYWKNRMG